MRDRPKTKKQRKLVAQAQHADVVARAGYASNAAIDQAADRLGSITTGRDFL